MTCDYCGARATTHIPTIPGQVCEAHAREFWTGLVAYARSQSRVIENQETAPLSVARCDKSVVELRLITARPATKPHDTEREPLRRAS